MAEERQTQEEQATVEERFARLDQMLEKLEDPSVTLEESFRLYQEGMDLLKKVSETLDDYEKKIRVLTEDGEVSELT